MAGEIKYGRDRDLEELADEFLNKGVRDNKRSPARDAEKMAYECGFISLEELRYYDPTNDWDTHDSAFTVFVEPSDLEFIDPSICDGDDGNVRVRNSRLQERHALMRHVGDDDDWGPVGEEIPLLGVNEGPRKTCAKCKKPKGFMLFSPKADTKDGLHPWCKECRKEIVSQKRNNARSKD